MKKLLTLLCVALAVVSCNLVSKWGEPKVTVEWIEGDLDAETKLYENEFVVRGVPTDAKDWTLWLWTQTQTHYELVEADGLKLDHYRARAYMLRPDGEPKVKGELRLRYRTSAKLWNASKYPSKFAFQQSNGKASQVEVIYRPLPLPSDGEQVYATNAAVTLTDSAPEHIVPALKSICYAEEGTTDLEQWQRGDAVVMLDEQHPEGWYRITLDGAVKIEAADEFGAYYAATTLENINRNATSVRNMVIEDYPDFDIRGYMIHLAGSPKSLDEMYRLVDLLSHYKMNLLHLHLTDDYGWRIEIPAIPDLTTVGARAQLPQPDGKGWYAEDEAILSTSVFDMHDKSYAANRYYTRDEYIALVKYAAERKVRVLPEVDFPGHSRAVVQALRAYERRTGDASYRPTHPDDTSEFSSAQGMNDNTFDVALESTYAFMDVVFAALVDMHREAGVPLTEIHIGGDEVPEGAWVGSPACQELLAKHPKSADYKEVLYSHFINRTLDVAEAHGVKICGWHEIVEHLDKPTWRRMAKQCAWINFWGFDRMLPIVQQAVANGVKVVLSNCQTTYLEEMYSLNKEENGNGWAGAIDIKTAFSLDPYNPEYPMKDWSHIIGVQSQLWSIYLDLFTFPKGLGNFDRAWNAKPVCSYDSYYSRLVNNELSYLDSREVQYHIPQPGLKIENGMLVANEPFKGGEVRYTFGEQRPSKQSALWSEPVAVPEEVTVISARYFYAGRESVTTTLRR